MNHNINSKPIIYNLIYNKIEYLYFDNLINLEELNTFKNALKINNSLTKEIHFLGHKE